MKQHVKRWVTITVWFVLTGWALLLLTTTACSLWSDWRRHIMTRQLLDVLAYKASEFHGSHDRWPNTLDELVTYVGISNLSNDAWGGVFFFKKPDDVSHPGKIWSYGKDKSPGGRFMEKDVSVEFGVSSNRTTTSRR